MIELTIPAMSCGHCVHAITEAVQALDPKAEVKTDLATHQVQVQTSAAREAVAAQLTQAGYPPA